ncbi:hypothetical protein C9374_011002 [Naegleria lovaniensis]|uniref:Uncharacterized protein n=1 Tax=Naegleria lovaniensis TaxID=51637 RepID=A0AA88KCT9_NAELO|nr:uncharacterized protein C9374_011002 [Naegleria lovaniensis]KAG2374165.1 hypothetical protein C9374_011002 [Naegleria lovaniensis]
MKPLSTQLILFFALILISSLSVMAFSEDTMLSTLSNPSSSSSITSTNVNNEQVTKRDLASSSASNEKHERIPDMEIFEKAYRKCISECSQVADVCNKACNLLKLREDNRLTNFQNIILQYKKNNRINPAQAFLQDLKDATILKRK